MNDQDILLLQDQLTTIVNLLTEIKFAIQDQTTYAGGGNYFD